MFEFFKIIMNSVRKASTLILVAKVRDILSIKSSDNFRVLTIQRSDKSSHFPNANAFPGGHIDEADKDLKWLDILPNHENSVRFTDSSDKIVDVNKNLSTAISSRIAAVRETFEECGILLCRNSHTDKAYAEDFEVENKGTWRKKICNDAKEFYNLCAKHKCYPDVEHLYLWSNWCTPKSIPKRFDTKFYFAAIDDQVKAEPDFVEIQACQWRDIDSILQDKIFLPPPQFYELSRLQAFHDIDTLVKFSYARNDSICEQYMPLHMKLKDGFVILLPGDELYEEMIKNTSEDITDYDQLLSDFNRTKMHRIVYEFNSKKQFIFVQNCVSNHHVLPKTTVRHIDSKL